MTERVERPARMAENYDLSIWCAGGYETVVVNAGSPRVVRVVPPAGEAHAFRYESHPIDDGNAA